MLKCSICLIGRIFLHKTAKQVTYLYSTYYSITLYNSILLQLCLITSTSHTRDSTLFACLKQFQSFVEVHDSSRHVFIIQGTSCVPCQLCSLLKLNKGELSVVASVTGGIGLWLAWTLWLLRSWLWDRFGCRVMCVWVNRHSSHWWWVGLGEPHCRGVIWRRVKVSRGNPLPV